MAQYALLLKIQGIDEVFSTTKVTLSGSSQGIPVFGMSGLFFGLPNLYFGMPFAGFGEETKPLISASAASLFAVRRELSLDGSNNLLSSDNSFELSIIDLNYYFSKILESQEASLLNRLATISIATIVDDKVLVLEQRFCFVTKIRKREGQYTLSFRRQRFSFLSKLLPNINGVSLNDYYARAIIGPTFFVLPKNPYDPARKRMNLIISTSYPSVQVTAPDKDSITILAPPGVLTKEIVQGINSSQSASMYFEGVIKKSSDDIPLYAGWSVTNQLDEFNITIAIGVDSDYSSLAFNSPYIYGVFKNKKEFVRVNSLSFTDIDTELVKLKFLSLNNVTRGYFFSEYEKLPEGKPLKLNFGSGSSTLNHAEVLLSLLCSGSDQYYAEIESLLILSAGSYAITSTQTVTRNGFFLKVTDANRLSIASICVGDLLTVENWPSNNMTFAQIIAVEKLRDDVFCVVVTQTVATSSSIPAGAKLKIKSRFNKHQFGIGIDALKFNYRDSLENIMSLSELQAPAEVMLDAERPLFEQINDMLLKPFGFFINQNRHGQLIVDNALFSKRIKLIDEIKLTDTASGQTISIDSDASESASFITALFDYSYPDEKFLRSMIFSKADSATKLNAEYGRYVELKCYQSESSQSFSAAYFLAKKLFKLFEVASHTVQLKLPIERAFQLNLASSFLLRIDNYLTLFNVTLKNDDFSKATTELYARSTEMKNIPSFIKVNECRIAPSLPVTTPNNSTLRLNAASIGDKVNRFFYPFGLDTQFNGFDYFVYFINQFSFQNYASRSSGVIYQNNFIDIGMTAPNPIFNASGFGLVTYAPQSFVATAFNKAFYRLWAKIGKSYTITAIDSAQRQVTLNDTSTIATGRHVAFYSLSNPSQKSKLNELPEVDAVNHVTATVTLSFIPSWVAVGMRLALMGVDDERDDGYTVF